MTEDKPNVGTRIGAMLIDHMVMTFIAVLFFIPGMLFGLSVAFEINHEPGSQPMFGSMTYFGLIGFALYFCKDSINGRSIAKRAFNLQVVEHASGRVASPLRCFVRNLFCIIWPVELIVTLINPGRRLGDLVAGTRVVVFDPETEQPNVKYGQAAFVLALAGGFIFLTTVPFMAIQSGIKEQQISYVKESVNEQAARETVQLFADSLGEHLTADVRVYDHIKNDPNLKYVSVILRLNENYLEDDEDFEQMQATTVPLLLAKFPEDSFTGQIRYVYQGPGQMRSRSVTVGTMPGSKQVIRASTGL